MILQETQQFLKICINKFPVSVAQLAVLFVKSAICLPADIDILQGHATALTDQLPGRAQQGIDGNIKQFGKKLQSLRVGHRFAGIT